MSKSHTPTLTRLIVKPTDSARTLRDGDIVIDGDKLYQVDYCEHCDRIDYNDVRDTPLATIAADALRWYNVAINRLKRDIDAVQAERAAAVDEWLDFNNDMRLNREVM